MAALKKAVKRTLRAAEKQQKKADVINQHLEGVVWWLEDMFEFLEEGCEDADSWLDQLDHQLERIALQRKEAAEAAAAGPARGPLR